MNKKGLIEKRLQSSVNFDVINGDNWEKQIFLSQIKEGIAKLVKFRQELINISTAKRENFLDADEFILWAKNRATDCLKD